MIEAKSQFQDRISSFRSLSVKNIQVGRRRISGDIIVVSREGSESRFRLAFTYSEDITADENTAGLMLTMPLINFTYFSERLILGFPVSEADRSLIDEFLRINAREVFINKICRRRYEFFRKEFLPDKEEINEDNAGGNTVLHARETFSDSPGGMEIPKSAVVLSSGGKESLLTYGMLSEIGTETHAFYFNESGGHWRTAKTAYDYFNRNFPNVSKVWSNVDRFYRFMISKLDILDMRVVGKRADTYPIQLFIFPVYIFSYIPLLKKHGIGNILMGNEFDDPKDMPEYMGMKHYFGVFDQTGDFMDMMTAYFRKKGISARLWSAVYAISGILVEHILINRYHDLYLQQRSCHSCRIEEGLIKPCGTCTKCLGVMMFILAAGGNPMEIHYSDRSLEELRGNVEKSRMRVDPDEFRYLEEAVWGNPAPGGTWHVRGIHALPDEKSPLQMVPDEFRNQIGGIFKEYSNGTYALEGEKWVQIED